MRKVSSLILTITFSILLASRPAGGDTATPETLYTLATKHFTEPRSEAESFAFDKFFKGVQEGQKVELSPNTETVQDSNDAKMQNEPAYADRWDDRRVVKAAWINWLCTDVEASKKVTSKGIEIDHARISGPVDLAWLKLEFPIRFFRCGFTDDISLDRATIRGLQLQGTYLKGMHGDGLSVDRDLTLEDNCVVQGVLWLREAAIGGSLCCDGSQFLGSDNQAINLRLAKVGATVLLRRGFSAEGEVSLHDATVGATVDCTAGQFSNPGGIALDLQGAKTGSIFLSAGFKAEGEVWLHSVTISGILVCSDSQFINPQEMALDMEDAKIGLVLLRPNFTAAGQVNLNNAAIGGTLECDGGQFINRGSYALSLMGAKTGSIYLRKGFRAEGKVDLTNAVVDGTVDCEGGHFINQSSHSLSLQDAKTGSVFLRNGFRAEGLVWLDGTNIGGDLDCDGGQFINPRGTALELTSAKTGAVYLCNGFRVEGMVNLYESVIDGNLECRSAHFLGRDTSVALAATSVDARLTTITGSVILLNFETEGHITFQDAQIGREFYISHGTWGENAKLNLTCAKATTLLNDPTGFPPKDQLRLHAFAFDALQSEASLEAKAQQSWISLQPSDNLRAQPFEQMAKVLRNMGREEAAADTMIAKNEDFGSHIGLKFPDIFWYYFLGPLIGYGYHPWNAFFWSLAFIGIGWILFNAAYHCDVITPTNKDAYEKKGVPEDQLSESDLSSFYPRFSAFVYSLETFVPLLKLWMSDYWAPNATRRQTKVIVRIPILIRKKIWTLPLPIKGPGLRVYLWIHVAAGWVLTTLWVGGLTGLLKT